MARHNWKGGHVITDTGYKKIRCEDHPRCTKSGYYVYEHILIMEKHLGRLLEPKEHVHHIDHNRQNNDISNLQLMTINEHSKIHSAERRKEIEKRRCNFCSQKTRIYRKDKTGYKSAIWIKNGNGWLCGTCWRRFYMRKKRLEVKGLASKG